MGKFAVWALGADRPGIVAAVTGAVLERGGNLADCSMTILAGQFAMVLVVDGPDALSADALEAALAPAAASFHLGVSVRALTEEATPSPGPRFELAVYGADRPGIVHNFAVVLADAGVNITDLATRVIGSPDRPVYAALVDLTVPEGLVVDELAARLDALADELGVDATLHAADADIL